MFEHNELVSQAGIGDQYAFLGRLGCHEDFIMGHLAEAYEGRRFDIEFAEFSVPLDDDRPVRAVILDQRRSAWKYREFLRLYKCDFYK